MGMTAHLSSSSEPSCVQNSHIFTYQDQKLKEHTLITWYRNTLIMRYRNREIGQGDSYRKKRYNTKQKNK